MPCESLDDDQEDLFWVLESRSGCYDHSTFYFPNCPLCSCIMEERGRLRHFLLGDTDSTRLRLALYYSGIGTLKK